MMAAEREEGANKRARSDGFSEERKRLFLVALRQGEAVLDACRLVGVSNRTAYNHRDRDPDFARDWSLARQMTWMPLELAAFERGVAGVEEPVYAYGKLSHTRVRRSDGLLKMLLVGDKPKKYGRGAAPGAERKRLDKRIDKRIAAEIAPLREALRAAEAGLEALRTPCNRGGAAVNFVNPRSAAEPAPRGSARKRERHGGWRLAAARRRCRETEISRLPRLP